MSGSSGSGPQTLQDFLINIRYNVDETSQRKTETGLKQSTFLALEAGKAFIQLAKDAWDAAHRVAESFDALYFASQRTGATIESIKALGYAARQAGISAESMSGAIENVAKLMATNPAGEGFLKSLGVQTRDANGRLIETGKIVENLGATLSKMPLPQANVVAGMFGIDYKTLLAMRQGMGQFSNEYRQIQAKIHFDSAQAGVDANRLATNMRSFGMVVDVVTDKLKARFSKDAADSIRRFRNYVVDNFDTIEKTINWAGDRFHDFIGGLEQLGHTGVEAIGKLVTWFNGLDSKTKGLIETFGLLIGAWKLLNTAFATSPLGRIILLSFAIISLLDDYNKWRQGSEHLIPWEKWTTQIDAVNKLFDRFAGDLGKLWTELKKLGTALSDLFDSFAKLSGSGEGSASSFFAKLGSDAFKAFQATLHNVVNDLIHMVQLMEKVAKGDWAGAMAVLKEWKYGTPEEKATADKKTADSSRQLDDLNNEHARQDGGDWFHRLFQAPAPGESPTARFFNRVRRMAGGQEVAGREDVPTPSPGELGRLMDLVGRTEGTGNNYNDTFGHGAYGGKGANLQAMTLDQIDDLQTQMLRNGGQSPVGRFQFNRDTLRDMRKVMGLTGNELFDENTQRTLFARRIRMTGGPTAQNMRGIWPSLPGGSQDTHQATQSEFDNVLRNPANYSTPPMPAPDPASLNVPGGAGSNKQRPLQQSMLVNPEAFGNSSVNLHQKTEINVHGNDNPIRVAQEVERGQGRVNRDLLRNGRTALT